MEKIFKKKMNKVQDQVSNKYKDGKVTDNLSFRKEFKFAM